jgi:acyl-CoA thioesterase-1
MIISKTHALKSFFICLMMTLLFTNVNAQDPIKIMLYGDSLMAGYGLPQKDNLASELSREIKSNDSTISFINASISGNTSKNGLSRVDWSLGDNPNIVILCLGANDMLRGLDPSLTKNNLDSIINKFINNNAIIILAGMQSPESMGPKYKKEFDAIYPDLSAQYNLIFMPFLLKGVALEKELLQADFKHPNAKGIRVMADNLNPYILQAIDQL